MNNNNSLYQYRNIARIIVEASSALAVGTGDSDIFTDAPVARDVNGLPYIPATSIAGVVRHALGIKDGEPSIFGYHDREGGKGSQVIFTDAVMVGAEGNAIDGLAAIDWKNEFYAAYRQLPIRQHVRINGSGTAENGGKFDNEVVYKGTRFVFEMEIYSKENRQDEFSQILNVLSDETLRFGGGTRKGYGKLQVIECQTATLDLTIDQDLHDYIAKSSSLAGDWKRFVSLDCLPQQMRADGWTRYELQLQPSDFFLFGSGMGDDDADNTPMTESVVKWNGMTPTIVDEQVLIPASAVKGALAHRTAYHYNRLNHLFVENADSEEADIETKATTGNNNPVVAAIFGTIQDGKTIPGSLYMTDVIEGKGSPKVFYHNRIDAFTGGTIDGALFQEKSIYGNGQTYTFEIGVADKAFKDDSYREAFERSLQDICEGLLPLGGTVNRGNGTFIGQCTKNGMTWKR